MRTVTLVASDWEVEITPLPVRGKASISLVDLEVLIAAADAPSNELKQAVASLVQLSDLPLALQDKAKRIMLPIEVTLFEDGNVYGPWRRYEAGVIFQTSLTGSVLPRDLAKRAQFHKR